MSLGIVRNSSYILASQILSKILAFLYTIYLAKNLGVDNFGLYSVALSYFSLVSSISDFGISRYLIREISRNQKSLKNLLVNVIILRLTVMSLIFAVFTVIISILDPNSMRVAITLIAVSAILPQAIAITLDGILVAFQKISISAITLFFYNLVSILIGFYLVSSGFGAFGAVSAVVFGHIIYLIILLAFFYRQTIKSLNFRKMTEELVEVSAFKEILKGSLPYGFLGILGLLYFKIDTLLLSYLKGSYDTGIYAAAYRFLETLVFIPSALATVVFPVFARLHDVNNHEIKKIGFKIIWTMGLFGCVILVGYITILPIVINWLLPSYSASIDAIRVLALAIPFMFIHIPLVQIVLTTEKYLKEIIIISVLNVSFNIILNLIFIPKYGFMAAAWITVLSDIFSLVLLLLLLYKHFLKKSYG